MTGTGTPLWRDTGPTHVGRPGLGTDIDADVAIIGAGFTGLWAAYYLLREDPSLRVVLLEREHAGFGASGRNGGWCSAIFPVSASRVERLYDRPAALALQRAMNDTVHEVGRVCSREGITCDFDRQGFLSLARGDAQLVRAKNQVESAAAFGMPGQWAFLGAAEARSMISADGIQGGAYTEHCATVHPAKLVAGLAHTVEDLGAVIYEQTEVTDFTQGRVTCRQGRVRADVVIRATEAYTPQFNRFRRAVAPVYSLVVATEPLPDAVRADLGQDSGLAFNDMHNLRTYARSTADGRLVFGGRGVPYHFGSAVDERFELHQRIHRQIVETMVDFFPKLADVEITHRWGGPLGVPRDWFPSVGYDRAAKVAWGGPYVGDGVATSNLAGRILRDLILDQPGELDTLPIVNHRSPTWEPEPLRWLGINAGLQAAALADREERVTRRPSQVAALLERMTGAH